jgi:hypothetical protein
LVLVGLVDFGELAAEVVFGDVGLGGVEDIAIQRFVSGLFRLALCGEGAGASSR